MSGVKLKASVNVNSAAVMRVKAALRAKGEQLREDRITVGLHDSEGAAATENYKGKPGITPLLYTMMCHEFGTDVLPERSWFRSWFDQNANRFKLEAIQAKREEYHGDASAIERLAAQWRDELRAWIADDQAGLLPLLPATEAARVRAGLTAGPPLHATGQFVSAIQAYIDGGLV